MKRTFLKKDQFSATHGCFIGTDFIGNGHWLMSKKLASNRSRFQEDGDVCDFVEKDVEVQFISDSIDDVVNKESINGKLEEAEVTDVCLGNGVAVTVGENLYFMQAHYANQLKDLLGAGDQIVANGSIVLVKDSKDEIGFICSLYEPNDTILANRNRKAIQLMHARAKNNNKTRSAEDL